MNFDREVYYKRLNDAYKGIGDNLVPNDDKKCTATINQFMLEHSTKIFMLCAHLSVFRDHFYDNNSDDDMVMLKDETVKSLEKFFNNPEAEMSVIMTDNDNIKDFVYAPMKSLIDKGRVKLYVLSKTMQDYCYLRHFTITDSSIARLEDDETSRTATCSFGDEELKDSCNKLFKILLPHTEVYRFR